MQGTFQRGQKKKERSAGSRNIKSESSWVGDNFRYLKSNVQTACVQVSLTLLYLKEGLGEDTVLCPVLLLLHLSTQDSHLNTLNV